MPAYRRVYTIAFVVVHEALIAFYMLWMSQHDLGDRLMPAFQSGSSIPFSDVNLLDHTAHAPRWGPDSSTSEVTSIQMEFIDLSRQTGDPKYEVSLTEILWVFIVAFYSSTHTRTHTAFWVTLPFVKCMC